MLMLENYWTQDWGMRRNCDQPDTLSQARDNVFPWQGFEDTRMHVVENYHCAKFERDAGSQFKQATNIFGLNVAKS